MSEYLQKLSKEHTDIYIMGDFNINLLNYSDNNSVNDFVDILYNSFRPPHKQTHSNNHVISDLGR